ncbi:MAG: DUF4159 domain-containing protein, partial [Planctomycetota bacterium]|nr:DUF4159 domain-containing protein [Planctomycetota bacterium]
MTGMRAWWLGVGLLALATAPAAGQDAVDPPAGVDSSAAAAGAFLKARIGPDGMVAGEYPKDNPRYGGRTGLCAYALLSAKTPGNDPALARAMAWLRGAKLRGTYATAMRAGALAAMDNKLDRAQLASDAKWLIDAARADGSYTYTPPASPDAGVYDNSNSQLAVLGVWEAWRRGVDVPAAYWRNVETHWRSAQQADGGWGYFAPPPGIRGNSYGSMTAAGLATLFICQDVLYRDRFTLCREQELSQPIARGLEWLAKRFDVAGNPGKGVEWQQYWLYSLERTALASGWRDFGGHDWYALGAAELLSGQNRDGSFADGPVEARIEPTAFALLFLGHGRNPVVVNKLRYRGLWNTRPRDAANFAAFLYEALEKTAAWQVVDVDALSTGWDDAPILYISGAGPCRFSDLQMQKLRDFALRGGLIVSEAACSNGAFTLDIQALYRRMFPAWPLERLGDDQEIYTHHFKPSDMGGLLGVSNGVRLLAIHSPQELSLDLQLGPQPGRRKSFELLTNAAILVTDRGRLPGRGQRRWPTPGVLAGGAVVPVARLEHDGNPNPEPLAWEHLTLAAAKWGVQLDFTPAVAPTALRKDRWPVAVMTGTKAFTLTKDDLRAIGQYLASGGTLVVLAAGGAGEFVQAAKDQLLPLADAQQLEPLPQGLLLAGPVKIDAVHYRDSFALTLPQARRTEHRLQTALVAGRPAIVFSKEDAVAGLLGYEGYRIPGYTGPSATALVTTLATFSAESLVEEKASDVAQFGLAAPSLKVSITTKDTRTRSLLVGDETVSGGGFYAKLEGDPRVFTIFNYNRAA